MSVMPRDPRRPQRIQSAGLGRLPAFSHASMSEDLIFVSGTLGTRGESFVLVDARTVDRSAAPAYRRGRDGEV